MAIGLNPSMLSNNSSNKHDDGKKIHHLYHPQPINGTVRLPIKVSAENSKAAINELGMRPGVRPTIVYIRYRLKHPDYDEMIENIFAKNENDAKSEARKAYYKKTHQYLSTKDFTMIEEAHDYTQNGATLSDDDLTNLFLQFLKI